MNKILLLLSAILLSSCGAGYFEARSEYYNSPAGQQELRQQFTLDSIRASRTQYPFNYGYNYYWNRGIRPIYYNYYRPYGVRTVVRPTTRRVVRRTTPTRTRVTRTTPRRNRQPIRRPRTRGSRQ